MMERETVPSMSDTDEIHHSIADADDMEAVWEKRIEVGDVFRNLIRHPFQLLSRWNWKAALLGAMLRSTFYYTVYQASGENRMVIMAAVAVEFVSRFLSTGIAGAVVQSFRRSTPIWQANIIVSIVLPAFSHTVEFVVHYGQERYLYDLLAASETSARLRTFAISVLFSVISVLFNLFAMRHGVLLVGAGEETKSLGSDIKRLPRMVGEFTAWLPVLICKYLERGRVLKALFAFASFGIAVGTILGVFRFKLEWAYRSALGAWAILLFSVILTAVVRHLLKRKGKMYRKRYS